MDNSVNYSLYILGQGGTLTQHTIVPHKLSTAGDGDDAPVQILHTPKLSWNLTRYRLYAQSLLTLLAHMQRGLQ